VFERMSKVTIDGDTDAVSIPYSFPFLHFVMTKKLILSCTLHMIYGIFLCVQLQDDVLFFMS
jgi:hypothetical protein